MRALVIAPQPFFSPRGTPFSVYYRTLVTSELGVEVDLLTYGEGQDPDLPGVRIVRIPRFGFLGPIPVGPSAVKAFLDVFVVLWTLGLLVRHRYDVVHAHEEAVFFCRFLKPVFRFRMIYDMHSSLPQQLTNFAFTKSRLLIGAFEALENSALRAADGVITICPELADYAVPRMPDPGRHFLIENSIFEPVRLKAASGDAAPASVAAPLPEGRPIVAYAGTMEAYQGIGLLLDAFAAAKGSPSRPALLLVGGSAEQVARYREHAARAGIADDTIFTGRVPQSEARRLLDRAAVLVSPRIEGTNTPLKIYEQLASGKPLVATRILSHTQVLDDDVCFLADPDASSLGTALRRALEDREEAERVVRGALSLYERRYSRPVYVDKMKRLFARVLPCAG